MTKVLITGSTGMIGKGVLLECIDSPLIEAIILINRSSVNMDHPKVKEVILSDFLQLDDVKEHLGTPDACFHCMGVSAVGMSEEDYTKITFEVTKNLADLCFELNPSMTFNYVSGTGTDSSENGRQMWARVKGKTENYILAKGFKKAIMFRPGMIIPEKGIRSRTKLYNVIYTVLQPFFPLMKKMNNVTTTTRIGLAMINSVVPKNSLKAYFNNQEINKISGKFM